MTGQKPLTGNAAAAADYIAQAQEMRTAGNLGKAIECAVLATQAEPDEIAHRETLAEILGQIQIKTFHPQIRDLVEQSLHLETIDRQKLMLSWLAILRIDPSLSDFYRTGGENDFTKFKKSFAKFKDLAPLTSSYFILGLQNFIVSDLTFECFLTYLRRLLLENAAQNKSLFGERHNEFLAALALYCFRTEYAFFVSEEEGAALDMLAADNAETALLLSCYRPFYDLPDAANLATAITDVEFLQIQYRDWLEQQEVKKSIPALTPVSDPVSQNVREQYEGFPYPRWKTLQASISLEKLEDFLSAQTVAPLKEKNAHILIAGCGTGRQALEYGMAFPDAQVLAIDLSLASLSYAAQKQKERSINNVTFKQADILELKELENPFDLIVSTGVLHHMEDPLAGWRSLTKLLKPGGLMRIALYSESARQFIVRARNIIAEKGYAPDAEGIRRFRRDAPEFLPKEDMALAAGSLDFYSLSECRDMLFHVQETRYDLPRLRRELDELGLEFIKFELPAVIREQYHRAYPEDPAGTDLDCWRDFEKQNPLLFLQMYRFWCRKP